LAIRLVVGLGNPGAKYESTRHNAGFMLVDRIASAEGLRWEEFKSAPGDFARGASFWLAKPMTFMNDSGEFVQPLCHFYKIKPEEVLVCFDDVALPLGRLRLRPSGSAGGHNGMKSIIRHLGTDAFPRLRIGVGQPAGVDSADHVLRAFGKDERPLLDEALARAEQAVAEARDGGLERAMNRYNQAGDTTA
jgi:peptidyl-tRNA hydrolase, PTH1 family